MPISVVFDPPLPSDSPSTFNTKAFTLLGDLNDWSTQANALPGEVATNLSALLAAPPAIGGTTPAAGSFTTLSASGKATFNAANTAIQMSYVTGANSRSSMQIQGTDASSVTKTYYFGTNVFSTGGNLELRNQSGQGLVVKHATNEVAFDGAVTIPGSLSLTGGTLGYGTGAGGTVTQATSKSTAVTLNKPCGRITTHSATMTAGQNIIFLFNNSLIGSDSGICIGIGAGSAFADSYRTWIGYSSAGQAYVGLENITTGLLSDAVEIVFQVISGATS